MRVLYPLGKRVVIQRCEDAEVTKGGIVIPDESREAHHEGVVVFVGPEVTKVKPGDKVLTGKWIGTEIMMNEVELCVIMEDDIHGVIREVENANG